MIGYGHSVLQLSLRPMIRSGCWKLSCNLLQTGFSWCKSRIACRKASVKEGEGDGAGERRVPGSVVVVAVV